MTAEVALLSKVAVALAVDSAATISAGNKNEKVFNSEDKLFELSNVQPIGIMIYNAPYFLETPIQILIKRYRSLNRRFANIDEATEDFKSYINEFGLSLDSNVRNRSFDDLVDESSDLIEDRLSREIRKRRAGDDTIDVDNIFAECLQFYEGVFAESGKCEFLNDTAEKRIIDITRSNKRKRSKSNAAKKEEGAKFDRMMATFLRSAYPSSKAIGVVIAGYGESELFPSLRSFQIDGMIGSSIRIISTKSVDIKYGGPHAKIVPYAQQEMVDRFVCGIDIKSQSEIERTCKNLLESYRSELLHQFDLEGEDKKLLEERLSSAESVFMQGVREEGFDQLKERATSEMESMIEFMPKPDLAQMAEALVELTSIKRRVSKGFDTVGGPIDVAAEGFVWVKRKHYFTIDRNQRYVARLHERLQGGEDGRVAGAPSTTGAREGAGD